MRGDLKTARGNLHACKFLQDLTIIQIRTVTAEWCDGVLSAFARRTCYNSTKEGRKRKERRRKEGGRTREKERERRNS